MTTIRVPLKGSSYSIVIEQGVLSRCGSYLKKLRIGRDAVVITNPKIFRLYGQTVSRSLRQSNYSVRFELVPDSERAKSAACLIRLAGSLAKYDKYKELFIIALGGGVAGDLAGFVAAVYKRGIPYVQMPTTLLAQVDSSIGGKVAIDLPVAKNMLGAFYQPRMVLSDVSVLKTLAQRNFRNGMAEVIKYGVIKDLRLFELLEGKGRGLAMADGKTLEHIVSRSARIKAEVVGRDEFDSKGIRAILNYGHTIGHALESASSYSGLYNHGEAIAIGMVVAADISASLGILPKGDLGRIENTIKDAGLPTNIRNVRLSDIYEAHLHDKKFMHRKNRFVLPERIGKVRIVQDIPEKLIRQTLRKRIRDNY